MPKYVVRFGVMRALGLAATRGNEPCARGMRVVVRTNRGVEAAEVLCAATEETTAKLESPVSCQILRELTEDDRRAVERIDGAREAAFGICRKHVAELDMTMQLVDIEQILGGERVIVYYLAEDRVDFRDLVKRLSSEFQTRVEMRQIGVRDEAKLLADYGDCGKPVCCNTHLLEMPPVSMKMAKVQKATLDPTKISGRCGRLKCCLRYEYDTYVDIQKELPPIGSDVVTNNGRGRVVGQEILVEQLLVEMEDHRRLLVHVSEVLTVLTRSARR